jgi:hypothetical protein
MVTNQPLLNPAAAAAVDWLRPSVHPRYARLLCAELRRRGIAPEQLLQGTGLAWDTLPSGQAFLSLVQLQRLVTQALALSVGLSSGLSSHGALGLAAVSAGSLGGVLHLLPRFSALRLKGVSFVLNAETDLASLVLQERLPAPELLADVLGHVTGAVLRLLQSVTGQPGAPGLVLDWPLPEMARRARRCAASACSCEPQRLSGV